MSDQSLSCCRHRQDIVTHCSTDNGRVHTMMPPPVPPPLASLSPIWQMGPLHRFHPNSNPSPRPAPLIIKTDERLWQEWSTAENTRCSVAPCSGQSLRHWDISTVRRKCCQLTFSACRRYVCIHACDSLSTIITFHVRIACLWPDLHIERWRRWWRS